MARDKRSTHFIQLALETLKCQQKDLAKRLKVSPTQISLWKNGESMSLDAENKIRAMIKLGDRDPSVVVWAGSVEAHDKWAKLIDYLAEEAAENAETGYDTAPLIDERDFLLWNTFDTLIDMGVKIPTPFPAELDFDYAAEVSDDEDQDRCELLFARNPYSALIYNIYLSFNDVYGFYIAYVDELLEDEDGDPILGDCENIQPCLMSLAASKLDSEPGESLAPYFRAFKYRVLSDYRRWLKEAKDHAFRAGIPIRAELMDLVTQSTNDLSRVAEAQSLGFNDSRLHPDIYMNELLVGMRTIHQVLPAIMKKLGISPEEFQLDEAELSNESMIALRFDKTRFGVEAEDDPEAEESPEPSPRHPVDNGGPASVPVPERRGKRKKKKEVF